MRSESTAGVSGKSVRVAIEAIARGSVSWDVGSRQGVVPIRLFGDIVRVIAYDSRR